ncbi:hypothetical protein MJH12_10730, partial [bacterium]|nr:hypothetical protein [bacterium]
MKKSIIHSIRFLFSSYYSLFSILVFGIFFLVIEQDYWYTINQAFTVNSHKIRELETQYDQRLTLIKNDIQEITSLSTEKEALFLRKNYPKVSDQLLKKYLSSGQYNQVKRSKIFPPIVLQIFQFKKGQFEKINQSIHSLFDPNKALISSNDKKIKVEDFPLIQQIQKLNLELVTLHDIQNFEISNKDLASLHQLGNLNRPLFFNNEHFSEALYEDLIHSGSQHFKLLEVDKEMAPFLNLSKNYFSQSAFGL